MGCIKTYMITTMMLLWHGSEVTAVKWHNTGIPYYSILLVYVNRNTIIIICIKCILYIFK